ncbi:ACS family tartrate transporter-like MFS transporter [Paraburkholderia bannensis]|uniref:ACS family tartrate transporter-like MFS transporter n=1 Tax=Paraburkholderia bannensis TaxID=765414 RepID=A0A7W9WUX5_9BURK|nr:MULTISPECIES: MFS transporter [Paraburkholderia]MBB3261865.1 ACS family tartrate transporter-like MFS transporter [Paraburkholderia sp. WP4_3_2]MBB6106860.1 ACS family tartrate transporter-like MFS transporter [Paraburkholderia bannensis]
MSIASVRAEDDAALETRVVRRVSRRITPFIIVLYFLSFLNRVNVGFAGLTMNRDIGLTQAMFGVGAGIFFVGYIAAGMPSNLALQRVGARRWIAFLMVMWGALSAATAFASGPYSFYGLRLVLGLAEAGFFPGIILYLSYWFPARHRAFVTAMFMTAAPLANMIGSPISGALMTLEGFAHLHGWQWLFLVEGAPTVLLGIVSYFYLMDRPEQAHWLAPAERNWLAAEMQRERDARAAQSRSSVWSAVKDPRVLLLALVYAGTSAGLYAIGIWAPMIIHRFGFSYVELGFVNAIPNLFAVVTMVLWARNSDRTGERRLHVAIACLAAGIGMLMSGYASSAVMLLVGLSIANFGINAAKPPLWSMPTQFLSGSAAAAGIALINAMGSLLGGTIGPMVIGKLRDVGGDYSLGLYFVSATLFVSALLAYLFGARQRGRQGPQERAVAQR